MHIVLITHVYPPEHAHWGIEVEEMAEDLARAGHRVTVLAGWPSHPQGLLYRGWRSAWRSVQRDPRGFTLIRCGHSFGPRKRLLHRMWYYFTFALSTLLNGLTLGRVDVIVGGSVVMFGPSVWLFARLKGARYVYYVADLLPEAILTAGMIRDGRLYRVLRAEDAWLCRRADVISTLSDQLRNGILARGGIDPDKIQVIPFWLDGRKVKPGHRDNPWRRVQGIRPETFVVMYAGTIGYVSGAEMLTDVAQLLANRKDILLLIIGEGPVKDSLKARARAADLRNMRFLPFQPAAVLDDMQATADVSLITLRPEAGEHSVPSKLLGYLAAGRPVIASVHEASPTARTLRDGRCGTVVPPQDPAALAQAIRHAADHRDELTRMGANAREYFLSHYDRRCAVPQWQACLTSLGRKGRAESGTTSTP